jgi:glycosyltransferase involved in cell wall biosynthesis
MMSTTPAIVIVTERQLFPINAGSRTRIVTLIRSLRRLGFRVVLVTRAGGGWKDALGTWWVADARYCVRAARFYNGSPAAFDCSGFRSGIEAAVRDHSPVAVIAEYLWMAPCLRWVQNGALRLVDTLDVMHRRRRFAGRLTDVWVTCTPEEERRFLEYGDAIIAIQPNERDEFRALAPGSRVICLPHHVALRPARAGGSRPVVAIVGSANPCNVEGITAFVETAWPIVRAAVPSAELRVYGELAAKAPDADGLRRIGPMRDLTRAYRDAAVVINPARLGTGLKIKVVEALAHGKAVVTTTCGADGLMDDAPDAFIASDDLDTFGAAVAHLLLDRRARLDMESAAIRFAASHFSLDRVYAELLQLLRDRPVGVAPAAGERLKAAV